MVVGMAVCMIVGIGGVHADTNGPPAGRLYEVHGVKLYTQIFGHGPPIVFLHGGLHGFDNSFARQRDYFSAFRTVIGIDQRGHGHSPDNSKPFSYQEMADDTAALIEKLGLGVVDVIGHSDGANVGLILAHDHPQLVRRLAISGANLRSGLSPEETLRQSRRSPQDAAAKFPPQFRTQYQQMSPDGPDHWFTHVAKSEALWLQPVVIEPTALKAINIPVLVIAGDHDFTSLEETTEIYRGLSKGQLLILPATEHGTFEQRPELLNAALKEFLEQP